MMKREKQVCITGLVAPVLWILTTVSAVAEAKELSPQTLVIMGPNKGVAEQIEYLRSTWPDQFAIAVVRLVGAPTCTQGEAQRATCRALVQPSDLILVRWLNDDPRAPGHEFQIHYWYSSEQSTPNIKQDEELLVFLAPTHGQGTYVCTLVAPATAESVGAIREALRQGAS